MSEYLDVAIEAAREAGKLLAQSFGKRLSIKKKGDINLVTDLDHKSEALIKRIISDKFPDHDFLAEEGTESRKNSPYLWLVDPLDGTTNYAHGFPVYCISIGLSKDNQIIAACIFNPNLDECFTAEHGEGAFLNGRQIAVSQTDDLDNSFLATGFPYDIRVSPDNNLREFAALALTSRAVRRAGSAALDLAYTACGRFDGYWEQKLSPWDMAAGVLLVEEAGGIATSWSGGNFDIFKGQLIASNGKIHRQMIDIIKSV